MSSLVDWPIASLVAVVSAVALAWGAGRAARLIGQPPVIGELIAGVVLGPSVFGALMPDAWSRWFTPIVVTAIGCAAINDAAAWTLLGVVVSLANGRASPLSTVALAAVYVGVMLLVVRLALDRVASLLARRTSRAGWMACVGVAAAASVIVSERAGLHAVFGALLAGVCVPRRPDVLLGLDRPLRSLIAPVLPAYFILIGMRAPIGMVAGASGWAVLAGVTFSAAIGKLGPSAVAARFAGFSSRDAFVIGSLLNTRGLVELVELVALDVGRDLGILSPALFAIFVVMTLVTTFMTMPFVRVLRN
jgi:Kef-type K+ transport system membrane component KefB